MARVEGQKLRIDEEALRQHRALDKLGVPNPDLSDLERQKPGPEGLFEDAKEAVKTALERMKTIGRVADGMEKSVDATAMLKGIPENIYKGWKFLGDINLYNDYLKRAEEGKGGTSLFEKALFAELIKQNTDTEHKGTYTKEQLQQYLNEHFVESVVLRFLSVRSCIGFGLMGGAGILGALTGAIEGASITKKIVDGVRGGFRATGAVIATHDFKKAYDTQWVVETTEFLELQRDVEDLKAYGKKRGESQDGINEAVEGYLRGEFRAKAEKRGVGLIAAATDAIGKKVTGKEKTEQQLNTDIQKIADKMYKQYRDREKKLEDPKEIQKLYTELNAVAQQWKFGREELPAKDTKAATIQKEGIESRNQTAEKIDALTQEYKQVLGCSFNLESAVDKRLRARKIEHLAAVAGAGTAAFFAPEIIKGLRGGWEFVAGKLWSGAHEQMVEQANPPVAVVESKTISTPKPEINMDLNKHGTGLTYAETAFRQYQANPKVFGGKTPEEVLRYIAHSQVGDRGFAAENQFAKDLHSLKMMPGQTISWNGDSGDYVTFETPKSATPPPTPGPEAAPTPPQTPAPTTQPTSTPFQPAVASGSPTPSPTPDMSGKGWGTGREFTGQNPEVSAVQPEEKGIGRAIRDWWHDLTRDRVSGAKPISSGKGWGTGATYKGINPDYPENVSSSLSSSGSEAVKPRSLSGAEQLAKPTAGFPGETDHSFPDERGFGTGATYKGINPDYPEQIDTRSDFEKGWGTGATYKGLNPEYDTRNDVPDGRGWGTGRTYTGPNPDASNQEAWNEPQKVSVSPEAKTPYGPPVQPEMSKVDPELVKIAVAAEQAHGSTIKVLVEQLDKTGKIDFGKTPARTFMDIERLWSISRLKDPSDFNDFDKMVQRAHKYGFDHLTEKGVHKVDFDGNMTIKEAITKAYSENPQAFGGKNFNQVFHDLARQYGIYPPERLPSETNATYLTRLHAFNAEIQNKIGDIKMPNGQHLYYSSSKEDVVQVSGEFKTLKSFLGQEEYRPPVREVAPQTSEARVIPKGGGDSLSAAAEAKTAAAVESRGATRRVVEGREPAQSGKSEVKDASKDGKQAQVNEQQKTGKPGEAPRANPVDAPAAESKPAAGKPILQVDSKTGHQTLQFVRGGEVAKLDVSTEGAKKWDFHHFGQAFDAYGEVKSDQQMQQQLLLALETAAKTESGAEHFIHTFHEKLVGAVGAEKAETFWDVQTGVKHFGQPEILHGKGKEMFKAALMAGGDPKYGTTVSEAMRFLHDKGATNIHIPKGIFGSNVELTLNHKIFDTPKGPKVPDTKTPADSKPSGDFKLEVEQKAPAAEVTPQNHWKQELNLNNFYGGKLTGSVEFIKEGNRIEVRGSYHMPPEAFRDGGIENRFFKHQLSKSEYSEVLMQMPQLVSAGKLESTSTDKLFDQLRLYNHKAAINLRLHDELMTMGKKEEAAAVLRDTKQMIRDVHGLGLDRYLMNRYNFPPALRPPDTLGDIGKSVDDIGKAVGKFFEEKKPAVPSESSGNANLEAQPKAPIPEK
ncbi:hypothetical protein HY620_00870 [Candidatus Uhrbacteria bacterium]|nr:hypothetical protein [Candidatus Uhrbacteria bacterium]